VERFRFREASAAAGSIHDALATWAGDAVEDLRRARPDIPVQLHDRAADGWEPLLAIADSAGGGWPSRARAAAVALSGAEPDEQSVGIILLECCRQAFEVADADRLPTQDLLASLIEEESAPFGGWWGRAIDAGDVRGPASKLRRLLDPYRIKPKDVRFESGVRKGYLRIDFEDAWERYVPASPPPAEPGRDNATSQGDGVADAQPGHR